MTPFDHRSPQSLYAIPAIALKIEVKFPTNARVQSVIDKLATAVLKHGYCFEKFVADNEADNPDYAFLAETDSEEHLFYRWRLHALSQGDSLTRWRTTPYQVQTTGAHWVPPPMPVTAAAATQPAADAIANYAMKRDGRVCVCTWLYDRRVHSLRSSPYSVVFAAFIFNTGLLPLTSFSTFCRPTVSLSLHLSHSHPRSAATSATTSSGRASTASS